MSINDAAIAYSAFRCNVRESCILISTTSTSRANRSNVTSIHSLNSNEESRRMSVVSFSVQILMVSGPMFIKFVFVSKHLVNIPSLLIKALQRFERQRQFVSAMISQGNLHVTRWTNVESNFLKFVAHIRQIVTSAQ